MFIVLYCIYRKKSACKVDCTVETHGVQGQLCVHCFEVYFILTYCLLYLC